VSAGRQEGRDGLERAQHRRSTNGEPTVFFLDEIHRFNKAQQDTLLPAVEEGLVVLIGATTENPFFEVNSALLSRCRIYELRQLGDDQVLALLRRSLGDERGEDPRFIARRMVIFASEDIGNADPRALQVAVAAAHAVEHVGLPECALNLSQAAIYLALAPKSNAAIKSLGRARAWVREHGA